MCLNLPHEVCAPYRKFASVALKSLLNPVQTACPNWFSKNLPPVFTQPCCCVWCDSGHQHRSFTLNKVSQFVFIMAGRCILCEFENFTLFLGVATDTNCENILCLCDASKTEISDKQLSSLPFRTPVFYVLLSQQQRHRGTKCAV